MRIKELMTKNIIYCDIDDSLKCISEKMKKYNIGFIPIKDNNEYVGVISDRDIALCLTNIKSIDDKVKDYMTKNIISIDMNENLNIALDIMGKYKIKRLLVKEKDKYIGVLSLSDILNVKNDENVIHTISIIFYNSNNEQEKDAKIDDFYL